MVNYFSCVDPAPEATYAYDNVTCAAGVKSSTGAGSNVVSGTCAANVTDTCDGVKTAAYTCGATETKTCVDVTSCSDGFGPDNDTITSTEGPFDVVGGTYTCASALTDTCNGNKMAAYACVSGFRGTCTDVVCTDTASGADTITVNPSNPITVTGTCADNAEADTTPSPNKSAQYTCQLLDEGTYTDIYSCTTTPAPEGEGDTYVNATAPVVLTGTCGTCVNEGCLRRHPETDVCLEYGKCVDEPVGCTQGTCGETPLTDTCNSDKAGAYTCGSAEVRTCTDVVCAAAANVNYAKYSTRSITCKALGADTCNNVRSAEYDCPNTVRKTCVDVLSNPPTFEGYRDVTCRTYNGTSCVAP